MNKHTLHAEVRENAGKRMSALRKTGKLPGTVYGKQMKSVSISVPTENFLRIYKETGETGLIELVVGKTTYHVLIHTVSIHPLSAAVLNVEFHRVDLKEKVHAKIPVVVSGESPAVAQKLGVLLVIHDSIEVEALPTDLPEHVIVDSAKLTEVNQEITASQVELPSGVALMSESDTILVKIGPLVTKEAEAEVAADAAQAAASAQEETNVTQAPTPESSESAA